VWKRISGGFRGLKLGHKLLAAFLLVSILPILFVQIFSFRVNKNSLSKNMNELMVSNLRQISERVNLSLQVYSSLVYQIYKDEQIIESIRQLTDDGYPHKAVAYNRIVNLLKQYNSSEGGVRCLCIVCPDGSSVVYDFETDSSINTIWSGYTNMLEIPPYVETIGQPGMVVTDTMQFKGTENKGNFFHISKSLFDFDRLDQGTIGTVTMTVDQSVLNSFCNNADRLERNINFIMNEERTVISYPDGDFAGITINPDLDTESFVTVSGYLRNRNIAVNRYTDPATGWIYCNVYDEDYVMKDISRMQRLQIAVTVIVIFFAALLIYCIVREMDHSVQSVVGGMQEVEKGNLDVVVPVQSFYEIGIIADNFNNMTVKVKQLIEEVGRVKEQQKDAEIRALEAQINPHFLYNTLDSINWMAIEKEEYEISKMLRDLGVILRYSINRSNQIVTIQEMVDWLSKYIGLQQMRFNDAFSWELNVEPDTYKVKVHKLLLQPFIENAIIHGFRGMEHGGLLRTDILRSEDGKNLVIIIEDNGSGMEADIVRSFNDREEAVKDDGRSIGLHNAFSRMSMYYGDAASWKINSIAGIGTVITIRLPMLEERQETGQV